MFGLVKRSEGLPFYPRISSLLNKDTSKVSLTGKHVCGLEEERSVPQVNSESELYYDHYMHLRIALDNLRVL